ncbi:MAG: ABC transporter permease [Bacteroidales bacterium]|nr:ABC transporter permease [Candidatus Colimorpha onthohippi]
MNRFAQSLHLELRHIKKRPRYLILTTLGIVFSYVFFLTFMSEGQPERLPIAVVDHDASYLSRRLCHEINATQGVEVVAVYNNHSQARQAMQRQEIFAFLEIPKGTYSDILSFKRPHIALYANNTYLLGGSFTYKSLATISRLASGAVQREILRKKGYTDQAISGMIQPIELDTHTLSNPTANYQPYILTTMLPGIIGLMTLLMSVFVIHNELKRSPTGRLREMRDYPISSIWGQLFPYTFWFSLLMIMGNVVLFGFFHFTLLGSFWTLVIASVLFIVALQSMAVFLVGLLPDMHIAVCIGAIYGTLAFTMSGFSFPVCSMPSYMQGFSAIFPLRHYYLTCSEVAYFDSPAVQYLPHLVVLLAFTAMSFVGMMLIRKQINNRVSCLQ